MDCGLVYTMPLARYPSRTCTRDVHTRIDSRLQFFNQSLAGQDVILLSSLSLIKIRIYLLHPIMHMQKKAGS